MRVAIGLVLVAMVITGVGAMCVRSPEVQDRLIERAIRERMSLRDRDALFEDDALRLLVCGSASPLPAEDRARPCLGVIAGGKIYFVDTGPGSWNRLALLRIPGERVGAVLLTHFHSDHIGDLGEFNMQTWVAGRPGPLPVYGPAGVERIVAGYQEAYALDSGYRIAHHGPELLDVAKGVMEAHPLTLAEDHSATPAFEDGELRVTVFPVSHQPIEPAVGYRFDYKGRSIAISGDTIKDAGLVNAARGVDLLAHEAQNQEMVATLGATAKELQRPRYEKIFADIPTYHTSPVEAAQAANEAGAKTLLLYHLTPPPPNRIAEMAFLRGVAAIRPEGVVLAKDGMLIELPLAGGSAKVGVIR